MEDLPENFYQAELYLRKGEELESGMTQKMFIVSISNEDPNNFIIKATNGDEQEEENYILHLKYSDYITKINRDFTRSLNSLKLLFDKLKSCFENEKVVIFRKTSYSINIIFSVSISSSLYKISIICNYSFIIKFSFTINFIMLKFSFIIQFT